MHSSHKNGSVKILKVIQVKSPILMIFPETIHQYIHYKHDIDMLYFCYKNS